ncbi:universal stress protein [Flavobacteriaceae bacterium 3-367]|uniref:universal stress protein n=1 Tax=Eudoraea algarum TaxID=3417568 RepID=UPI00328A798C
MRKILVPTDFSENAWNATKYAIELFKGEECTFYLLNTYTPTFAHNRFMASTIQDPGVDDIIRSNSEKGLQNLQAKIKKRNQYPNHRFKTVSSFCLLVEAIRDIVDSEGIDFIVTGTKGASGIEEVFMGSNTVRIIKSIKRCPVLAIPMDFEYATPSEIAFATDFNRFYTLSELQPLIDLARAFDATLRIVHVQYEIKALTEIQQFNLEMLRKYLGDLPHYVHTVTELNSVSKTLEVFTNELGIHLLAMLHYQHSYLEKMTREPIIKRVAFHTQIPLLVIPELGMGVSPKPKKKGKNLMLS